MKPSDAVIDTTLPIAPSATSLRTARVVGKKRVHIPSIRKRRFSRAFAMHRSACAAVTTIGFSHSTCLPASRSIRMFSQWKACGVAT